MNFKMSRKRVLYTAIVTIIVVFSSTFAILMTLERMDYRNYLQGEYSKNMYELINSVQNIRVNLGKSAITGSKEQNIAVFGEIFRYSSMANDKIHSLPISEQVSADTGKFLSQVGDFCYVLSKSSSEGKNLTEGDYQTIDRLKNESFTLEKELKKVSNDISEGKIKWSEIRKNLTGVFAKNDKLSISEKFEGIQKQVTQYPALIYDGPFSDNMLDIKPKINMQKEVSSKEAEEIAKNIIGKDNIASIKLKTGDGKGKIDSYKFVATLKNKVNKNEEVNCEISKNGGKVLYMLNDRGINPVSLDTKKATESGSKYLASIGYKDMIPTYILNYGDVAVISYVYNQNNTVIYPDQIKLKVALDDGSVVGIESEKYLVSHDENRKVSSPKISVEQAKERVGKRLNINNTKLTIIPTETNKEVLCYEFSGNYREDNFKVYINAETGYEQRIIQIINTPDGELTM